MAVLALLVRRAMLACVVLLAVWLVHGPILATSVQDDHDAVPHAWTVSTPQALSAPHGDVGHDESTSAAQCLSEDGHGPAGHAHASVFMPVDVADAGQVTAPGVAARIDMSYEAAGADARTVGNSWTDDRPVRTLICVSRT